MVTCTIVLRNENYFNNSKNNIIIIWKGFTFSTTSGRCKRKTMSSLEDNARYYK